MNGVQSEMRLVVPKCRGYIKDRYSNDVASEVQASTSWKIARTMFHSYKLINGASKK